MPRFGKPLLVGLGLALLAGCVSAAEPTTQVYDTLKVSYVSSQNCQAEAPADWAIVETTEAAAVDLYSVDQSMAASWGILAVPANWPLVPPMIGPWDDPDVYSDDPLIALMGFLRHYLTPNDDSALERTSEPRQIGNYSEFTMQTPTDSYVVFYSVFPGDGLNSKAILVVRMGRTTNDLWATRSGFVAQIAASIRCTVQTGTDTGPDLGADAATAADNEGDEGYNPWLGAEYVTNPDTGQNFLVTNQEWSSDGPDGPGYYYQNGNDWVKLQPGRTD